MALLRQSWVQKNIATISNFAMLNVLFNPFKSMDKYESYFRDVSAKRLMNFYKLYNGCRLFSDSLNIYGFQTFEHDDIETYDLEKENRRLKSNKKLIGYNYFGSIGGQYLFGLKQNSSLETVYCVNVDNGKVITKFKNFDILFDHLFDKLYDEYDQNGIKIHKNEKYKNIKTLYNLSFEKELLKEK